MAVYAGPDIVNDGLVLCLDAANPRSYPGSGGVWFDISGNGNDFWLINSPTFLNNRFSLDAANANFLSANTINLTDTKVLTFQFLFRPKPFVEGSTTKVLFEFSNNYNGSQGTFLHNYLLGPSGGIGIANHGPSYNYSEWDKSPYDGTNWKFGTVIIDRNINGRQSYFYTQSTEQSPLTTPLAAFNNGNFGNHRMYIGSRANFTFFADFEIAYFSIYKKILNQSEITQNYNCFRGRFNL